MTDSYILTPFFLDDVKAGLMPLEAPGSAGWSVNNPSLPEGERQQRMVALYLPLRDKVTETARRGDRPISVAGDCCTSLAVLAGLQQAGFEPTLIWLDAHGDFNTWETTPSGFLGGMPLAMLVGRGEQTLVEGVGLDVLPESRVILTDARDLDPGEKTALESSAVTHLPDITALLEDPLPDGSLYVHFDADVIDPAEVPAMSYPAPGGPSVATMRRVLRRLARTGQVVAVSVSAWNPELDEDGRSRDIIMSLLPELVS